MGSQVTKTYKYTKEQAVPLSFWLLLNPFRRFGQVDGTSGYYENDWRHMAIELISCVLTLIVL